MSQLIDSYPESNCDGYQNVYSTYYISTGQTFSGSGIPLTSVKFLLKKNGNPTGNAYAKLYPITGTSGVDGKGTGDPLAVSDALDVSTLGTSGALFELIFSTPYTPANGTNYAIQIAYSGGDSSNYVQVGGDITSPSHAGNRTSLYYNGTWYAVTNWDMVFYAYGTPAGIVLAGDISAIASSAGDIYESVSVEGGISASGSLEANILNSLSIAGNISAFTSPSGNIYESVSVGGCISVISSLEANILNSLSIAGNTSSSCTLDGLLGLFYLNIFLNGNIYSSTDLLGELLAPPLTWLEKLRWIAKKINIDVMRNSAKIIDVEVQRNSAKVIDVEAQRNQSKIFI
jgi:hypothetical protein